MDSLLTIYRFAVPTLAAPCDVTSRVRHVLRHALGLANIETTAACHVLHRVLAFYVISAAQRCSHADTSAHKSVVRNVAKTIVTYVRLEEKPELTS